MSNLHSTLDKPHCLCPNPFLALLRVQGTDGSADGRDRPTSAQEELFASGWDSHDYLERAHRSRIRAVDKPIAALISDLRRRGMLEDTLVVWCGEFGRSPDNGLRGGGREVIGRDHNKNAMAVWLAGGGVKAGHTIGATDEIGERAIEVARPIKDFHVTLLHLLGLDDNQLTFFHGGRFKQVSQTGGKLIRELLA